MSKLFLFCIVVAYFANVIDLSHQITCSSCSGTSEKECESSMSKMQCGEDEPCITLNGWVKDADTPTYFKGCYPGYGLCDAVNQKSQGQPGKDSHCDICEENLCNMKPFKPIPMSPPKA